MTITTPIEMQKIKSRSANSLLCAIVFICSLLYVPTTLAQTAFKEGDIIFEKIPCGNLCDAIIETTPCKPGLAFNHCGIVHKEGKDVYVIEAIGKAVKQSPIATFLKRDTSSLIYIGRLKPQYAKAIKPAVKKAQDYIGTPYDDTFLPGDSALYCSELVWDSYKQNGTPIFTTQPMTFKSPKTNATYPAWTEYYQSLHQPIPEGVEGINPCLIANSDKVELIVVRRDSK